MTQEFNKIGTFTKLPDGTIVPELPDTSKEEAPARDTPGK